MKFFGHYDNDYFIRQRVAKLGKGDGRVFVDVPAGEGRISEFLHRSGFTVMPFDLFPESFRAPELTCRHADLQKELPLDPDSADFLLCEEGIEHIPDQLSLLIEFNRVLKQGGSLLITTPNISCLRCKLSWFFMESDFYRRLPPTEMDAVWFSKNDGRIYYGHVFLINVQKLVLLAKIAGFELTAIHPMKVSWTSLLFGITYPIIYLANLSALLHEKRKRKSVPQAAPVFESAARLNVNPTVLFSKHLFIEFKKAAPPYEALRDFHNKLLTEPDAMFTVT